VDSLREQIALQAQADPETEQACPNLAQENGSANNSIETKEREIVETAPNPV